MKKFSDYDKIMQVLEAKDISRDTAERLSGMGGGTIGKLLKRRNGEGELGGPNTENFLRTFNVNREWWKTGEGEMFLKDANPGRSNIAPKETFYKALIEDNDDYSLIPRAVLKDYKIVPDKIIDVIIESNKNEKAAISKSFQDEKSILVAKHELTITGLENKILSLEKENKELKESKRQVALKSQ